MRLGNLYTSSRVSSFPWSLNELHRWWHVGHGLQGEIEQSPSVQRIFLQTHGQDGDCWEDDDCQDGDHGHEHEEGDSSEESNWLSSNIANMEPLPLSFSLNRFLEHDDHIGAGSVEIWCRATFDLGVVDGKNSEPEISPLDVTTSRWWSVSSNWRTILFGASCHASRKDDGFLLG